MTEHNTMVGKLAEFMGMKPAELTLKDVQAQMSSIRRKAAGWEMDALNAEKEATRLRERAFLPETEARERAGLMRQAAQAGRSAQMLAQNASVFIARLGSFSELETTMLIANQLQEVGIMNKGAKIEDWQKAMDSMQSEIDSMIQASHRISDVMSILMDTQGLGGEAGSETDLDALFQAWNSATDPAEKARIQSEIDLKSGFLTA